MDQESPETRRTLDTDQRSRKAGAEEPPRRSRSRDARSTSITRCSWFGASKRKSAEAYSAGKIGGFCHLYIGQEAVAIGAISAIRKDDYV